MAHLPKSHDCVFAAADPLPWMKKLLQSEALKKTLASEHLSQLFEATGTKPDPDELAEFLDVAEEFIPREIIVSTPSREMGQLGRFLAFMNKTSYCYGAWDLYAFTEEGSEEEEKAWGDYRKLQKHMLAEFRELRLPEIGVWLRFRSEDSARENFDSIGELLLALEGAFKVEEKAGEISVTGSIGGAIPSEFVISMLDTWALIADEEDELAADFEKHFRRMVLHLNLRLIGDGVLVRMGPSAPEPGEERGLGDRELGTLWAERGLRTMFWRWDVAPMKAELRKLLAFAREWDGSEVAANVRAEYGTDSLDDAKIMTSALDRVPDIGLMSLDGLKGVARATGGPQATPLDTLGISKLVPADAESFWLTATDSAGDLLSDMVSYFEDQVAMMELREFFDVETEDIEEPEELFSQRYYSNMERFRKLTHFADPPVFKPGSGAFFAARGELARVRVKSGRNQEVALEGPLPSFRFAIAGIPADRARALEHVGQLYDSLFDGARQSGKRKQRKKWKDAPPEKLVEGDLGLDVPTHVFSSYWRKAIRPKALEIEGDFKPHCFQLDEILVFSTSTEMSKKIVAAYRDTGKRHDQAGGKGVVYQSVFRNETLSGLFAAFGKWIAEGMRQSAGDAEIGEQTKAIESAFGMVVDVLSIFRSYRSTTVRDGDVLNSQFEIEVAD